MGCDKWAVMGCDKMGCDGLYRDVLGWLLFVMNWRNEVKWSEVKWSEVKWNAVKWRFDYVCVGIDACRGCIAMTKVCRFWFNGMEQVE